MLARSLHEYWLDWHKKQFPDQSMREYPSILAGTFGIEDSGEETGGLPYEEPEDHRVFQQLLVKHEKGLTVGPLQKIRENLVKMGLRCQEIDWDA